MSSCPLVLSQVLQLSVLVASLVLGPRLYERSCCGSAETICDPFLGFPIGLCILRLGKQKSETPTIMVVVVCVQV